MFDLPPDPPQFDNDPIIEALVECGLQGGGLTVSYDDLLSPIVHDNILARYRGDGSFQAD